MATNISDIPNLENQISDLKKQEDQYKNTIEKSPSAIGGEGLPTAGDVDAQKNLLRIQKQRTSLEDARLRAKWYPKETGSNTQEDTSSPGMISYGLDYINRPLRGIVGATKHAVGQGSGTLWNDIATNIETDKNTFGDVLRTAGVNRGVSAPIGFALDVALDPINWLTAGTSALVPRLFVGAKKGIETGEGVMKGLGIAAKSGIMEDATTLARYTPYLKSSKAFEKLGTKSVQATKDWETLSGVTAAKVVSERGLAGIGKYQAGVGALIDSAIKEIPGADNFLKHFVYDPSEWVRQTRFLELVKKNLGYDVPMEDLATYVRQTANKEDTTAIRSKIITEGKAAISEVEVGKHPIEKSMGVSNIITKAETDQVSANLAAMAPRTAEKINGTTAGAIVKDHDEAYTLMHDTTRAFDTADQEATAARMASLGRAIDEANKTIGGNSFTLEDLSNIIKSNNPNITGLDWYDNFIKKTGDYVIKKDKATKEAVIRGRDVLNYYERALAWFKLSKVVLSPTSWVNAVAGNLLMHHMATGNINPLYLLRVKQVISARVGTKDAIYKLDELTNGISQAIKEDSAVFNATVGGQEFVGARNRSAAYKSVDEARRILGVTEKEMSNEQLLEKLNDLQKELKIQIKSEADKAALGLQEKQGGGTDIIRKKMLRGEAISVSDSTGMTGTEILGSEGAREMFENVARRALENPTMANRFVDYIMNTIPSGYESIDQSFKLATIIFATHDGYTINELRSLRNVIDIAPEILSEHVVKGQRLYRLPESKAVELASVMFLNYAAMPSAVRVLRNIPLLSSPFISFMYGMSLKTGQTLAYNPSAFNKVTSALNEFGGSASPMEKQAIYDDSIDPKTGQPRNKYYSYLQQPGMYRLPDLPFLNQNPIYLNLANMIPYYSLNMFGPTNTNYGDSWREKIAGGIQKSTLMSDPAGNAIFENFLLPMILGDVARPQGRFGQPLYPIDATMMEKAAYGTRNLAESFVPNAAALLGMLTPEEYAQYAPLYRWRAIAEASAGKNVLGISSKEPASSRSNREKLKALGIPVQSPVNLPYGQ